MVRPLLILCFAGLTVAVSAQVDVKAEKERAEAITKQIGELASSGNLPTSKEGIELLRKLVDELSDIRKRLEAVESSTRAQSKTAISGFVQFQYRYSDQENQNRAFQIRRARLNVTHQMDPTTMFRLSADFATGTNQLQAQLKDAYALYTIPGNRLYQLQGGQFSLPISFQLTRGDLEREFPERTQYMSALFNGERSRGVLGRAGIGPGASVFAGVVDSLTIGDPEQTNLAPGPASKLAAIAGVSVAQNGWEGSLNGLVGQRPEFTNGSTVAPATDRNWIIANAAYDPAKSKLSARAEFMSGKDRVPGTANMTLIGGTRQQAWHAQLGYRLSRLDGLYLRYEDWNRDLSNPGFRLSSYGLAYQRDLTSEIRFVGAYESVDDQQAARRYSIATFRLQYRF